MPVTSPRSAGGPSMWILTDPAEIEPLGQITAQNAAKRKRTSMTGSKPAKSVFKKDPAATVAAEAAAEVAAVALPALLPIRREGGVRLALIGATGLVGRACSTYLAQHPELGYVVSHYVGSAESEGKQLKDVAAAKEAKLQKHYGEGFWDSEGGGVDPASFPEGAAVCDVQALLAQGPASCDVVLSFLAPRFGGIEDELIANLGKLLGHDTIGQVLGQSVTAPQFAGEILGF